LVIIALLILTPIGFYSKFYSGPFHYWANNSLGGVFYEMFWCLVMALIFNRLKPFQIACIVLFATCFLEFLQLWHPPLLELLRSNFIGVTIFGNVFTWSDFPYYFIGSALGFILLKTVLCQPLSSESSTV